MHFKFEGSIRIVNIKRSESKILIHEPHPQIEFYSKRSLRGWRWSCGFHGPLDNMRPLPPTLPSPRERSFPDMGVLSYSEQVIQAKGRKLSKTELQQKQTGGSHCRK